MFVPMVGLLMTNNEKIREGRLERAYRLERLGRGSSRINTRERPPSLFSA